MIKLHLVIVTMTFLINLSYGQRAECGTKPTGAEREQYFADLRAMRERPTQRIYEDNTIRLIMYRLQNDDGTGGRSDSEFAELVNDMNSIYNMYDICFSLMRIVNINNSQLVNADWSADWDSLQSAINNQYPSFSDAATIYVLPPSVVAGGVFGSSYGIPSTAFIARSNDFNWNRALYAHEMGHCLGLFHTHETNNGSNIELVTRTWGESCFNSQGHWHDCNVGGDGMCDTEADFNFNDNSLYVDPETCEYIFDSTDCQGNAYIPDPRNVMSYSLYQCQDILSGQQQGKMHLTLDIGIIFDNTQAPVDYNLAGQVYTSGYSNYLAKNSITVAGSGIFEATGSAQVIHEAENFVDLKPGFKAAPGNSDGFYLARAKDLCNNSTTLDYAINE